ncbi:uncharacterized protein LOC131620050 [Vicia villosa]|uniref:uncharacterized protein LOC131620047 n=1 Tax=Vicia villosa TaxID=3911 RepID=UPI00273CAADD|nr:uncharacterized protein LOC131620047 [Vicia villosa]XP_058747055.1 uncharacterized protein LOC131620048 [Vicia villosa]XP_058747056.1 uncharacterized protein LOC131620050 [Vicia villosa]
MAMTSFNGFNVIVIFMISLTLVLRISFCSEIPQPPSEAPSNDIGNAPRPLSSYEKYLTTCSSKLKKECGKEIFSSVFVGNGMVSDYCCHSLVNDVGKSCHFEMTMYAAQLPVYVKNKREILNRCLNVWNHCNIVR